MDKVGGIETDHTYQHNIASLIILYLLTSLKATSNDR